jgi:predicted RNA-binding protein
VSAGELRYKLISVFLQADGPLSVGELGVAVGTSDRDLQETLRRLMDEGLVVAGELAGRGRGAVYCWASRWHDKLGKRSDESHRELVRVVADQPRRLAIDSKAVLAFHRFVIDEYRPPEDKRLLVFFQCSVRRPFSTSPSHGTMRKAITVATGFNPAPSKDFERCPVHVVVLASRIGPVPYELEDTHPANIGGGGVKHFRDDLYAKIKPVLAERMAEYITTHGRNYDRMATFTSGRYGDVMAAARDICGRDFPIFPDPDGARITWTGKSVPRKYWDKFWIQLYLEILDWLTPSLREQAGARLEKMGVRHE